MTMYKEYTLTVDLLNGVYIDRRIVFDQNDFNSSKLNMTITNKKLPMDLTGCTVSISFLKRDKTKVFQECTIVDAVSGKVEVVLSSQTLAVPGLVKVELTIDNGTSIVSTSDFYMNVKSSIMSDDAIESTNEFSVIKKAIDAGEMLSGVDLQSIVDNTTTVDNLKTTVNQHTLDITELESKLPTQAELDAITTVPSLKETSDLHSLDIEDLKTRTPTTTELQKIRDDFQVIENLKTTSDTHSNDIANLNLRAPSLVELQKIRDDFDVIDNLETTSSQHSADIQNIQDKLPTKHAAYDHQIPGESTILYRVQGKGLGNEPYTLLEVVSPDNSHGLESEATITLMREVDSETGTPEFLDIYNNGYNDSRQMGVRIQSRGSGVLRDFAFEFNAGTGVTETMRVTKDELLIKRGLSMQKDGNKLFLLKGSDGTVQGHMGRLGDRVTLYNAVTETAFEFFDANFAQFYSPSGDFYIYLDTGGFYFNDLHVAVVHSGASGGRPGGKPVGYSYFDTTLGKPIWWNGSGWVDANGTGV